MVVFLWLTLFISARRQSHTIGHLKNVFFFDCDNVIQLALVPYPLHNTYFLL